MRTKLRLFLPLVQVAIAIVLTISNLRRPDTAESYAWWHLDRQLCDGVNAPVSLIVYSAVNGLFPENMRMWLFMRTVVYFLLVWVVWYIVSLEITGNGQSVVTPKTRMRRSTDVLAVVCGIVLIAFWSDNHRGSTGDRLYWELMAIPYLVWGVAIVVFYGHDLWVSRGKAHGLAKTSE